MIVKTKEADKHEAKEFTHIEDELAFASTLKPNVDEKNNNNLEKDSHFTLNTNGT